MPLNNRTPRCALKIRQALGGVYLILFGIGGPLQAQSASRDSLEAIGVAEALLRAISSRDTLAAKGLLVPGAVLASIPDPVAAPGKARIQTDAAFIRTLATGTERLLERLWSPRVILHGTLAEVHAPYDFHIDDRFSHCGTDVITVMRSDGAWRVVAVAYTVQRTGCTASPLGPPTF